MTPIENMRHPGPSSCHDSHETAAGSFKASRYNLFLRTAAADRYIVYNTLCDSIAAIDAITREVLEPGRGYAGPLEAIRGLMEAGMMVDETVDEMDLVVHRYYSIKFDMNNLIFIAVPTYACNLACAYCFQGTAKRRQTMDDTTGRAFLLFVEKMIEIHHPRHVTLILYGGEPLLEPRRCLGLLRSVWERAQAGGMGYHGKIITNGTLFSSSLIAELKPYLSGVQVSLDGPRKTHDRMRVHPDGRPTYETILNNLALLEQAGISTSLRINVDKHNTEAAAEVLDDLVGRDLHRAQHICPYFGRVVTSTRFCGSYAPYCLQDSEWTVLVQKLWNELRVRGFSYIVNNVVSENHPASCKSLSPSTYAVGPEGEVYNCLAFIGDPLHQMGKLNSDGVLSLNSRFYRMMRRNPFESEKCVNCVYLPRCGGGCTALAYMEHGTYTALKCPDGENKMKAALKFYLESKFPEMKEWQIALD